jgi:hypothetical protein
MTAAGVATLFLLQDMLRPGQGMNCSGNVTDFQIERGLAWVGANFAQVRDNYTLYGVERIGVASGYKYFGGQDWYAAGAERLVRVQNRDGLWAGGYTGA